MNKRLSETYDHIKRIESEITQLLDTAESHRDARILQQELLDLHREAQQLISSVPEPVSAHMAGMVIAAASAIVVFLMLRLRELRRENNHDHKKR